jgi:phosphoribosyl 1,2-cyclic phosphate phosphodiesterase
MDIHGFRLWDFAYLTDCSFIPESSYSLLEWLDLLIIDGLMPQSHATHFSFSEAVREIAKIRPKRAFLTHMADEWSHVELQKFLDKQRSADPNLKDIPMSPLADSLVLSIERRRDS